MDTIDKMRRRGLELVFDAGYLGGYLSAMQHICGFLEDARRRELIPLGYMRYLDTLLDAWKVNNVAWQHEFSAFEIWWEEIESAIEQQRQGGL